MEGVEYECMTKRHCSLSRADTVWELRQAVGYKVPLPRAITDMEGVGLESQIPSGNSGVMIFHGVKPCQCTMVRLEVKLSPPKGNSGAGLPGTT